MTSYYLLLLQIFFSIIALFLFWQSVGYFRRMWRYKKFSSTPFPKTYKITLDNIHQYKAIPSTLKKKLHLLILLFIDQKEFIGVKIDITDEIKVVIAFYASLMRLGFELNEKDRTSTIIIYPRHFMVDETLILQGQSANGTVVLSWQDIKFNLSQQKENVIIHEFAHELDFEDGLADGTPILEGSNYRRWSEVFSKTFDTLKIISHEGKTSDRLVLLGEYALTNEAEFFAICSERFFETPREFKNIFPDIYEQMKLFYRFDTISLQVL